MKIICLNVIVLLASLFGAANSSAIDANAITIHDDVKVYVDKNGDFEKIFTMEKMLKIIVDVNKEKQYRGNFFVRLEMDEKKFPEEVWVKYSDIVELSKFREWKDCWPISFFMIDDGFATTEIKTDSNGKGFVWEKGKPKEKQQIEIWSWKNIVALTPSKNINWSLYIFELSNSSRPKLISKDWIADITKYRTCK